MSSPQEREAALFRAAVELPPGVPREAFLAQACAGDAALRQRLEALLAVHQEPDQLLAAPAPAAKATMKVEFTEDQPDEAVGQTLGRYKLLEKVGEGGCGVVYVAEQTEPVRRRVALKVIKLGMDTKQVVARFEAERQALAMMDHPNIAKVLDAGTTETGRPYFIMELVRGIRITDYCDQNKLSTKERLDLFIKICQAIQHAHQKGIIHRDIKPSNILVTLHDGVPVPKVIDFGIAKATEGRLTDATVYTQLHQFIGTPAYMSPEQAEMSGLDVDTRSDVYSLGVLLYELLTGRTPFDAQELMSQGIDAMRKTIREKDPVRPSTKLATLKGDELTTTAKRRSVETSKLAKLLRGDLDWIVMKCLEKDRTRRYETANGLAVDIKRHLNNEPVVARPPSKIYEFQKTVRRHKVGFAATAAIIVVLFAGILMSTWQAIRATHARREAVAARLNEAEMREQAQAAAERATQASDKALALARHLRVETYASDMRAADAAINENNRGSALGLLKRYFPAPGEDDLRGVEWRYLWLAGHGDELKSFAHDGVVNQTVFSPNGRLVATACFDGLTHVWNVQSGREVAQFAGWQFQIPCYPLSFSPDGRLLAGCCPDGVVLRDTSDWRVVRQLPGAGGALAFSPDGKLLAVQLPGRVQLWDTATWQSSFLQTRRGGGFWAELVFSPDGRLLGAPLDNVWNVSSQSAEFDTGSSCSLAFAPGGKWLAAGYQDGGLKIWSLETKQVVFTNKVHSSFLQGLAFSPDGQMLATGGGDQVIHLWRWQTPPSGPPILTKLRTLYGHQNEVWSLDFSRDGRFLVSGGKDGMAMVWSTTLEQPRALTWDPRPDQSFQGFSLDGKLLGTTTHNDSGQLEFRWWNAASLESVGNFMMPPDILPSSGQGDKIWYGTTNGTIGNWDGRTGQAGKTVQVGGQRVVPVAESPDERRVLVWGEDAQLASLWNVETRAREAVFPDLQNFARIHAATFSPDDRYLAYATRDFQLKLWNITQGREQWSIHAHRWFMNQIRFSPDGKVLATASADGTVKLWDAATGKQAVPTLSGHLAGPRFSVFSSDGKTLVTSDGDTSVRFWNVATGKEMIARENAGLCDLSSDGNTLILSKPGHWLFGGQGPFEIIHPPSLAAIDAQEKADLSETRHSASPPDGTGAQKRVEAQPK